MNETGAGPNDAEQWNTWYWKQVEQAQQDINSGTDSFDKSMLTLSSGALGVSLAFIKDIVPLEQAAWISLLIVSWIAFALCIVSTVISFPFSIAAQKRHRELLDEIFTTKNHNLAKNESSSWSKAVTVCSRVALILFLGGLACTIMFVVRNVTDFQRKNEVTLPAAASVKNVRNYYMSGDGKTVEKVVQPQGIEKGRQPMKIVPPPKATAPGPCPTTTK